MSLCVLQGYEATFSSSYIKNNKTWGTLCILKKVKYSLFLKEFCSGIRRAEQVDIRSFDFPCILFSWRNLMYKKDVECFQSDPHCSTWVFEFRVYLMYWKLESYMCIPCIMAWWVVFTWVCKAVTSNPSCRQAWKRLSFLRPSSQHYIDWSWILDMNVVFNCPLKFSV